FSTYEPLPLCVLMASLLQYENLKRDQPSVGRGGSLRYVQPKVAFAPWAGFVGLWANCLRHGAGRSSGDQGSKLIKDRWGQPPFPGCLQNQDMHGEPTPPYPALF